MANPRTLNESKLIEEFVSHDENTMGVVTNSVGMVLLQLYKRYFNEKKGEKIEQAFLTCSSKIEKLAETKGSEAKFAVMSMNAAALQPVGQLDRVRLWFKSSTTTKTKLKNSSTQQESEYTAVEYQFPLKHVLTLVWMALNDDAMYAHHWGEEKDEAARSIAATSHREMRLGNFFNCLQEIQSGICHHGRRNSLVSLLDQSYRDVELILDNSIATMAFLRDAIHGYFWDKYEDKTVSATQKKILNEALMKWVAKNNPELILKLPHSHDNRLTLLDEVLPSLKNVFIKHGCHPDVVMELIGSAACSLPFSYDPKRTPCLVPVHGVLAAISTEGEESRNKALFAMQERIQEEWQLDNAALQMQVANFYALFMADTHLKKYKSRIFTRCLWRIPI